jgi:multiple sugar transport system permease protein
VTAASGPRGRWSNALFVAPYLTAYAALLVYPLAAGMTLSLNKADLFGGREYVGLENYVRLAADPTFRQAVANTFYFVLLTAPALTGLSLALALALNRPGRTAAVFRGVFFSSSVLSVTVVTLIWRLMLVTDGGLFANLAKALGRAPVPFLTDTRLVMPAMALVTVWWCLGLPMMLFLAALQQIPGEIYEAAALDNAGRWKTFWRITLPSITRTVALVLIIEAVLQFQLFGQPQILTLGGPSGASRPIVLFIYEVGFRRWDVGYASAASEILFVLILGATLVQYLISRTAGRA